MARPYCTVEDVRRILRSAQKKVRTSEAYRELGYNIGNAGTIRLNAITFQESYAGTERFEIAFSGSTSFEVTGETLGYLGIGDTGSIFTTSQFAIDSTNWSGSAVNGDIVYFTSCSNISTDDVEAFIDGVSGGFINNTLGTIYGDSTNIPWEADYNVSVPEVLKYVAEFKSACEIFRSVYAGSELDESPVESWCLTAKNALQEFIAWYEEANVESLPRWRSHDTLINTYGVEGEFEGAIDKTTDTEDDVSYKR
jgi:hypothetical protein